MSRFIQDKGKVHFNLARIRLQGEAFEIDIDPDAAIGFKQGKISDIRDALKAEHIYKDAKRGMLASEHELEKVFGTKDPLEVAERIIKEGEVQVSSQHREQEREQKKKRIIDIIHRNAVDPQTHFPHPTARIEAAIEQAKARIDDSKPAEQQVEEIIKQIRPVLPLKVEVKELEIKIPAEYATKSYSLLKQWGKLIKEEWQNDGSVLAIIEIPGGLEQEFYEKLNSFTHGNNEVTVIKVK